MYGDEQSPGGNGLPNGNKGLGRSAATQGVREEMLLKLLLMGFTVKEASGQMKYSYQSLCKISRQPEFLVKLRGLSGEIAQRLIEEMSMNTVEFAKKLEEASAAALDAMIKMMDDLEKHGPSKLRMQIAQDLLDRDARSSRTKRLDIGGQVNHDFISPQVLLHAASVAREVEGKRLESGGTTVIDITGQDNPADSGNGQSG
jgi:hypothetical protein